MSTQNTTTEKEPTLTTEQQMAALDREIKLKTKYKTLAIINADIMEANARRMEAVAKIAYIKMGSRSEESSDPREKTGSACENPASGGTPLSQAPADETLTQSPA